jgi:hypothetical protein
MGMRAVSERLERLYGATLADSLVDQIRAMDMGNHVVTGDTVSLERPEGTYVFDHVVHNANGGLSGLVTMYDPSGVKIAEIDIANVSTLLDDNRIDFSASVTTPDQNWTADGVLVGIQSDPGNAVALISMDGEDTRPSLVDFSGLAVSDSTQTVLPLLTITALGSSYSSQGGAAHDCPTAAGIGGVATEPCTIAVVVVVVVVAIALCIVLCWLLF